MSNAPAPKLCTARLAKSIASYSVPRGPWFKEMFCGVIHWVHTINIWQTWQKYRSELQPVAAIRLWSFHFWKYHMPICMLNFKIYIYIFFRNVINLKISCAVPRGCLKTVVLLYTEHNGGKVHLPKFWRFFGVLLVCSFFNQEIVTAVLVQNKVMGNQNTKGKE